MGKILVKSAVTRQKGKLYYIDGKGNVCEASMNRKGGKKGRSVCVAKKSVPKKRKTTKSKSAKKKAAPVKRVRVSKKVASAKMKTAKKKK